MKKQVQTTVRTENRGRLLLILGICFLLCGCLTGCSGTGKEEGDSVSRVSQIKGLAAESADYYVLKGNGLCLLCDKESRELMPLCFRSNCPHEPYSQDNQEPSCPAALLFRDSGGYVGIGKDGYYYIQDQSESIDLGEGFLMKADLDGENARTIASIPISAVGIGALSILTDRNWYTVSQSFDISGDLEMNVESRNRMWEINLSTGNCRMLKECVSKSLTAFQILDMDGQSLYYFDYEKSPAVCKKMILESGEEERLPLEAEDVFSAALRNNLFVYSYKENGKFGIRFHEMETEEEGLLLDNIVDPPGFYLFEDRGVLLSDRGCFFLNYQDRSLEQTADFARLPVGEVKDGLLFYETSMDGGIHYYFASWDDIRLGNEMKQIY